MKRSEKSRKRAAPEPAPGVATRAWFILGFLHLAVAALLGAVRAAPSRALPNDAHVLIALSGLFLLAGGLAYGFASPFLKREVIAPRAAVVPLGLLLAGDAALILSRVIPSRIGYVLLGVGLAFVPLHLGLSAMVGGAWRGGIALFAADQPFRRGDMAAGGAFTLGGAGFLAAGIALAFPPRGIASTAIVLGLLMGAAPFFAGVMLFLLPRNAKQPMPGITLVTAALAFMGLGALGLAYAFARPVGADFRAPAASVMLSLGLFLVAIFRLHFPEKPGIQLTRARPFLRGAIGIAGLASLVLVLSVLPGVPTDILPVALYLWLLCLVMLATGAALLGAPILLNAVPRDGNWGKWAVAIGTLGIFLLAPAFQYARPAFPGAAVLAAAALLLLWGVAPMRKPRRVC